MVAISFVFQVSKNMINKEDKKIIQRAKKSNLSCYCSHNKFQDPYDSGFTLMLSILVASVMLTLGLSIFNILNQQLEVSGIAKQSQFAFYAADTGLECALYHDFQGGGFSTSTGGGSIECGDKNRNINSVSTSDGYEHIFYLDFQPEPYCAEIRVEKQVSGQSIATKVQAKGYNRGWDSGSNDCSNSHPRKIQRAIEVNY